MATIAAIIRNEHDAILASWLLEVQRAASARGLNRLALANMMPVYLQALADELAGSHEDAARRRKHVVTHLATRIRQGFDLFEIANEFSQLGRSIAQRVELRAPADQPTLAELDALHEQIHAAIADATDAFYRHMLEDEQTEKRMFRMLQDIANEALHDEQAPLAQRLAEVLGLVAEATRATCIGFISYDASSHAVEVCAVSGAADLEPFIRARDVRELVGDVHDVTTTLLAVPEVLAERDVRSLIRMRLPSRRRLRDVMYIGIAEDREFTDREIHRFETIGERIALHLENARMFAVHVSTISDLKVEQQLREAFVAILAHDLRGPLQSARLAADLIVEYPDEARRRELAAKLDTYLERIDHMIRDLLDANRIHAGEALPLQLGPCDLVEIARRVVEEGRAIHGNRFTLEAPLAARGVWSEDELHRALWNLATNAVKYGEAGTPITIRIACGDGCASISVHNLGKPIAVADQVHLFEAYRRAPSTARDRIGWGLGLTLVRGCATAHGGTATVHSDATFGTTFTIALPEDARRSQTQIERLRSSVESRSAFECAPPSTS